MPQFFIGQTLDQQNSLRFLFAINQSSKELDVGAIVTLQSVSVRVLQLKTKQAAYQCVCLTPEGRRLQVNGQDLELGPVGGVVRAEVW